MCGILGIINYGAGGIDVPRFVRALGLMRARGPDDEGYLLLHADGGEVSAAGGVDTAPTLGLPSVSRVDATNASCAFGHRRLSILDLSPAGHQPMAWDRGRYWIVFNGEIYNYIELRKELGEAGSNFRSSSDTEVLLAAFAVWGPAMLKRLEGMFAFGILDRRERKLFIARDHFGIKPLYVVATSNSFAFSSEVRPLLELGAATRVGNPSAIFEYLRYGERTADGRTMYRDVAAFPAASFAWIDLDRAALPSPQPYWQPRIATSRRIDYPAAVEEVRDAFETSVRLHLRSDVPVGACLSGGLDSTAIVTTAQRILPSDAKLHAFTFVADDPSISEGPYASMVEGVEHHQTCPGPADLERDFERLMTAQDLPFGSSSVYAQFRVFELAQQVGVKVLLDGQGADEVFGGYFSLIGARVAALLSEGRVTTAVRLIRATPRNARPALPRMVLAAFGRLIPTALSPLARALVGEAAIPAWLREDWVAKSGAKPALPVYGSGPAALREEMLLALRHLSLPQLLRYEDRNSMYFSIESRVPYCAPRLAELALSLPDQYLISDSGTTKAVFREAMSDRVPAAILNREKVGFLPPERRWLEALEPWVTRTLSSPRFFRLPFLQPHVVRDAFAAQSTGRGFWPPHLWRILNLFWWIEFNHVDIAED